MVPPIPGLDQVAYLTNETVFDLKQQPDHLIVIGGGPIGMELAQAHRRLGARVTVLEIFRALSKDDPELTAVVLDQLRRDGVEILDGIKILSIAPDGAQGAKVTIEADGATRVVEGSHLLVAAGRAPNVTDLNLEAAGIEYSNKGVTVDARLRTTNKRVYAIGDATGGYQFTHMAGYDAGIVIRNALFRLPAKVDHRAVPWVTFTDPELAHVGMTEESARAAHGEIRVLRWSFGENDRAQAERATNGLIKVVTTKKGRILGASIVGAHAGELLLPWIIAVQHKQKIGVMASIIAPYPTLSEVSKRLAGSFYTEALFSERTRRIVRFLGMFG
jgi:pyruvate/2-oxoglutarate dehydrogenase complex dihydrolipoamide dehydrogenase (E3) component